MLELYFLDRGVVTTRFISFMFPLIAKNMAYSSRHYYPALTVCYLAKALPLPPGTWVTGTTPHIFELTNSCIKPSPDMMTIP